MLLILGSFATLLALAHVWASAAAAVVSVVHAAQAVTRYPPVKCWAGSRSCADVCTRVLPPVLSCRMVINVSLASILNNTSIIHIATC